VGVDLRARPDLLYPNQWGASDTDHRTVIDERRLVLPPFDANAEARVKSEHASGVLTPIAAHGALDYFVEFNASGRGDVDAQVKGHPYVLISLDGRLKASDGATAWEIRPNGDVVFPAPIAWSKVPDGARVAGGS
jgi:hypothetical protein